MNTHTRLVSSTPLLPTSHPNLRRAIQLGASVYCDDSAKTYQVRMFRQTLSDVNKIGFKVMTPSELEKWRAFDSQTQGIEEQEYLAHLCGCNETREEYDHFGR